MVKHPILNSLKQQIRSLPCYMATLGQWWTLGFLIIQGPRLTEKSPSQTFTSPPSQRGDRILNALAWKWHTPSVHNALARSTHIFPLHGKKARKRVLPCCKKAESRKCLVNSTDDYHMTLFVPQACKVDHTCYSKLNCVLLKQDFLLISFKWIKYTSFLDVVSISVSSLKDSRKTCLNLK